MSESLEIIHRNVNSLSRYRIDDEMHLSDESVNRCVTGAFRELRAYQFYCDSLVLDRIRGGEPVESFRGRFDEILAAIYDGVASGDTSIGERLKSDMRLSDRLVSAIAFIHRAVALSENSMMRSRRFVIIKEMPGQPTLCYHSGESMVLAHVGAGPDWTEIPTIYLGLKTLDAVGSHFKRGQFDYFNALIRLLDIEERAIETGYIHDDVYPPETSRALALLLSEVVRFSERVSTAEEEAPEEEKKIAPFTEKNRAAVLRDLDARLEHDELNFDYEKCMKAVRSLERLARRYKKSHDRKSLLGVVRLLVAASGHDIHEVRDLANLILERVFAPREFDAPLATRFITVSRGDRYSFTFAIDDARGEYFLRISGTTVNAELVLEHEILHNEIDLRRDDDGMWRAEAVFNELGHYDFTVMRRKKKAAEPLIEAEFSGRVNVIPDMRGQIILEIFPDIHGHTRLYWQDSEGKTGMVYNENGEVIRLGRFSDISHHLEDIRDRYFPTAIYLLGVQKRGENRNDWAPQATSPSPFSPMSLTQIEPYLGGDEEFRELVLRAHELGIKVIVDIVPHINRGSDHLPDEFTVYTYGGDGQLYPRASTDGRYGSWDDGKLLNYRKFEVWQWLANSVLELIDRFDIDGIRFDSAHSVPIMMKKNNYPMTYGERRSHEEMVEGRIITNDREYDHFVTTGYYDSACRDLIAVPFHYYLMRRIEQKLREKKKDYFVNIAECYWGHERFLTRTGLIPYNSSLFKICENIIHGKSDVREIYHIYDNYFPTVLSQGTELLGILGNHDERRALNTFGHRGLRAAVALTSFMSNVIMDYEGSAEGEGWKVFLDNIYVNWNQFEYASHRSLEPFYREWYRFHRDVRGKGYLVWANNTITAAAMKFADGTVWIGGFNFSDHSQNISIQFDNPALPIADDDAFRLTDPLYSAITHGASYYTGRELKVSRINTVVSYTDRVKLLKLDRVALDENETIFFTDSFKRIAFMSNTGMIESTYAFGQIAQRCASYASLRDYLLEKAVDPLWDQDRSTMELALKRSLFYLYRLGYLKADVIDEFIAKVKTEKNSRVREMGDVILRHNRRGSWVFLSAEAEPFSKSGGLANVVYELPRELAAMGETVYVISGFYRNGDPKSMQKLNESIERYGVSYTGKNVRFKIHDNDYEVGVHFGMVDGIGYYLLDHYEFFDGLYWGVTAEEKLKRRVAFARSAAEVILTFNLDPQYTFTNDAYAGVFNGIVRSDDYYASNPVFKRTTFLHIIHNGGWQYFDAYHRWEKGYDLFGVFNLPSWRAPDFADPVFGDRLSCMATGIRFADRTITVSPSYARQIEYASDGLERILKNVIGISNAIGRDFIEKIHERFDKSGFTEQWYPALIDHIGQHGYLRSKIEERYPEILKGPRAAEKIRNGLRKEVVTRMANKLMLQLSRGLTVDPDKILFTMIHRVSEQKGFQLLLEASQGIINDLGMQFIIGGAVSSGDRRGEEIAHGLYLLSRYYPDSVNVNFGFQDVSIPLLATDLFGMPSMHEPGGISQIEAFAAGSFVVARATGGLRDTVHPLRVTEKGVKGNGFLFTDYSAGAFYDAMERAARFMRDHDEDTIAKGRRNAVGSVYFWDRPAREYIETIYAITETIRIFH